MSEILYNFHANNASLDDINGHVGAIQEVRSDITNLFNVLATVYEGDASTALTGAQRNLDNMLDDVLNNVTITQQQAAEQQAYMQALDKLNAAQF
jgi:uncharacterized protein YukE